MRRTLLALLVLFAANASGEEFRDEKCGIRFELPERWTAVTNPRSGVWTSDQKEVVCTIGLRAPGWARKHAGDATGLTHEFTATIVVVNGPFLEVARRAGFRREGDRHWMTPGRSPHDWLIGVRQGEDPARDFRTACCRAVIGDTWGHARARDGSKASVIATLAVVNDGKGHSAVFEGSAAPIVEDLAASFAFGR